MSATETQLTEQHRQAQLALRARTLRDFALLWPIWQASDPRTFDAFVTATIPLVRAYRSLSATVAAAYYAKFRQAERAAGNAIPSLASGVTVEQILASLYATGQAMNRRALLAGQVAEAARQASLVRMSGAVARHVLNGGRDTILQSVEKDKQALGWARVTDGNPCYFCLTLASRGAVYKSEDTAGFEAHDHCGCMAMPVYDGTVIPDRERWLKIYDDAQRAGLESGLLQHGENSSAGRLNAVRLFLAAAPH